MLVPSDYDIFFLSGRWYEDNTKAFLMQIGTLSSLRVFRGSLFRRSGTNMLSKAVINYDSCLYLGSLTVYAVGRKLTIMYLVTGVSSQDIYIVLLKWHSIDIEIFFKLNSKIARRAINFFVTAEMFCIWCKSSPFMRLFIFNSLQKDVKLEPHNMHALTWNLSKRVPVYQNLERMIPSLTWKH